MTNPPFDLSPDNIARMITLLFGKQADGQPFWCIVSVKPSHLKEVQEKAQNKTLKIENYMADGYGEIVVSGEGVMPPREVLKQVSAMFNTPIRDMFGTYDMDDVVAKEIALLKKELNID